MKKIDEAQVEDLLGFEGIIVGSPTYFGQMNRKTKYLLDDSVRVYRRLGSAAFTSSGGTLPGQRPQLFPSSRLSSFMVWLFREMHTDRITELLSWDLLMMRRLRIAATLGEEQRSSLNASLPSQVPLYLLFYVPSQF